MIHLALPFVPSLGFTRTALAHTVLHLPRPHPNPLPDASVTVLFGHGDDARRALIRAWLDDARARMTPAQSIRDVLHARLRSNVPVLAYLPEAFALLTASNPFSVPEHAARVADRACWIAEPHIKETAWYTRRATVAGVYLAAELHQLTSPTTAASFLDDLLYESGAVEQAVKEVSLFGSYILNSWKGIAKSRGLL